jgi:pimeloyl-ACP methyl ester carboxylesterase
VVEHAPRVADGGSSGQLVVLVHGSLDRSDSFNRALRRMPELRVITYDRRAYQRSRPAGAPRGLGGHIDDLLAVVDQATGGSGGATAVGHSFGGDVVIGAAIAEPGAFASIGAFEPPMPWLGFRRDRVVPESPAAGGSTGVAPGSGVIGPDRPRWTPLADDPGVEAERFFRRMVGEGSWERLPASGRAGRRADGAALVDDLRGLRGPTPFDVRALAVPAVFGRGGPQSGAHHRDAVAWLVDHVAGSRLVEIDGAGHGAHLSHPDAFAAFVRAAMAAGRREPEDDLEDEAS